MVDAADDVFVFCSTILCLSAKPVAMLVHRVVVLGWWSDCLCWNHWRLLLVVSVSSSFPFDVGSVFCLTNDSIKSQHPRVALREYLYRVKASGSPPVINRGYNGHQWYMRRVMQGKRAVVPIISLYWSLVVIPWYSAVQRRYSVLVVMLSWS